MSKTVHFSTFPNIWSGDPAGSFHFHSGERREWPRHKLDSLGGMQGEVTQRGGDTWIARQAHQANGQVPNGGHNLRRRTTAYTAVIFIKVHVAHPVQPVFDTPVTAGDVQQAITT